MLNSFLIALREGFEIFLILAITVSYLKSSNRNWLISAVYWGFSVSVAISAYLGYQIMEATINQPKWEGILCLIAVVLVATLLYHMKKHAPKMRQEIHEKIDSSIKMVESKPRAFFGVFIFVVLMTIREGMETAFMMLSIREAPNMILGFSFGIVGAILMSIAWMKFSNLINIQKFFQVTTFFLIFFIAQLLIVAFHEFTEAGMFGASSAALHIATEPYSPDGYIGKWVSTSLVFVSMVWLIVSWLKQRSKNSQQKLNNVAISSKS